MDRREVISLLELDEAFLVGLEREAIVLPGPGGSFDASAVERIRLCATLQRELGVNLEGVEVALHLMEIIADERREFAEVLAWLRERMAEEGARASFHGTLRAMPPALAAHPARPVLDQLLTREAVRAEKGVAVARLVICVLALGRLLTFGFPGLVAGSPKELLALAPMLLGITWSAWILGWRRPASTRLLRLVASVTVDALIIYAALLSVVLWPTSGYRGLLLVPDAGVLLLATVTAGLRLSRRVAVVGVAEMGVVSVLLFGVDLAHNRGVVEYHTLDLGMWLILYAGAAIIALAVALGTRRLVYEGADAALSAERARQRLGVYVSEEVAAEALATDALEAGGHRQPVAVLFSDLRGFTHYAEHLDPERLVTELNAYLDAMVHVIREAGGVVDKFIGDAIMAVFGVPAPGVDDAARAIAAARAMNEALVRHNAEREAAGRPPLRHGIGVHYGPVVAGNIGNAERLQYTVVGDTVNLASRLESATKTQGVPVLISGEAVAAAQAAGADVAALEALGPVTVPGREAPVEVFSPRSS